MINIKLLLIILEEGYDKKIKNLLNKYDIKVKTVSHASGTASPSILDYFGIEETKKQVFIAIIPDYASTKILEKINTTFNLEKTGTGVALTIPITSSNKYLCDVFEKENLEGREIMQEKKDDKKTKYSLILTIVQEGYLEQVMNAAKKKGCSGGTVIKGRGLSNNKAKTLGFNIEPEKDIVLNIVTNQNKKPVMETITDEVGIKTPGMGICLSLPIEEIVGIEKSLN